MKSFSAGWFLSLILFLVLGACTPTPAGLTDGTGTTIPLIPTMDKGALPTPLETHQPIDLDGTPVANSSDPHSQSVTATQTQALSPSLSPTPYPCTPELCIEAGHFLLERPIAPPGRIWVDPTYLFGTTQNGEREPHHGVEFVNSSGTPVLAAAAGEVIVAGDDKATIYADWPFFYGNLVIVQHDLSAIPEPVYTLYAHLSVVEVEVGDQVMPGQLIGRVGFSGVATGSHLHFEVRVGDNLYDAVQNPVLWLTPDEDETGLAYGVLAGRVEDGAGGPVYISNLVVERLTGPAGEPLWQQYLETYVDPGLIPAEARGENFAIGDLPAGWYRLTFVYRGLQTREVVITPGQVTRVTFTIPN